MVSLPLSIVLTHKKLFFEVQGKPVPYTRTTQRGKFMSKQFARYNSYTHGQVIPAIHSAVWRKYKKFITIKKDISLYIDVFISGKKRGDLSNYIKGIEDAVQASKFIANDKQTTYISGQLHSCQPGEDKIEVSIQWEDTEDE